MGSRYDKEELKHRVKLRKIEQKGERTLRKRELKAKRDSYKKPKKKIQTSKVITTTLMIVLLLNCLIIEAYSCWAMVKLNDLSALYVLIGAAVTTTIGEILSLTIYSAKSYKETKAEKDLEFEYEKLKTNCVSDNTEAMG